MKLKDISTISSGFTFRGRVEASASGHVRIIQMRDLGADNLVHLDRTVRVDQLKPKANQLMQLGDIIFRSRGQTNTAVLLNKETTDAIVAAPLFRVRPNVKKIVPEYLLWWINQPSSQRYLASRSEGTVIKMVSKQHLGNLEVSLPPLKQQHQIVEIFKLSTQEQNLLEKIKSRKLLHTQGILLQMASGARLNTSNRNPRFGATTSTRDKTG